MRRALLAVVPSLAGLLVALLLGALVVLVAGRSPLLVAGRVLEDFTANDLGEAVNYATIFVLTGLAVAYGFQAGLFNIGGEGQLIAGGFVAGIVGASLPDATPSLVALPVCLAAAFAAGAAWAAVPAIMRARLGAHEVITTILMNLIAPAAAGFLLQRYREAHRGAHPELAEAMHTLPVAEGARVSPLERFVPPFEGSHACTLVFLALAAALVVWWVVNRTRTGFELRAVGHNAEAAHASGIPNAAVITKALLVSGGLAGLASTPFVLGDKFYYDHELLTGTGYGFTGIAVAVLAGNDALRVLVSAFLLALLTQSGAVVNGSAKDQVPKEIVLVLYAVVIVSVLVAQGIARRLVQQAEARRASRAE
jgi:simple sugar transport system permease protein